MIALQELVANYRTENQNLAQTIGMRDSELLQKNEEIKIKQQELTTMETRVQELMVAI
jgi:uncharacterized protein (DUF3084 family)